MAMNDILPVDASGLRVLITAGGSGIGKVMARSFHERGAKVHICDIVKDLVRETVDEIDGVTGSTTDVGDRAAVNRMFEEAAETLGGLDVLINNAGVAGPTANVEDIEAEALEETLRVNVEAQFYCSGRAVPLLRQAGGGSIINLSSVAGRLAFAMRTPYAAAKWGVIGFSKSLALELGRENIRVNAILPGHVNGPRFRSVAAAKAKAVGVSEEQMRNEMLSLVAMGKNVEMQDIANMALYLTSPFGAVITGQAISVCGGVEMMR